MDEETRLELEKAVAQLNQALKGMTPYKLAVAAPEELKPVEKNAHYMSKRVYDQLLDNIKRDGNLASLPFCWKNEQGKMVVLSGNHRVKIAAEAGVTRILVIYTDQGLSRSEQVAIQLSHNSLVGQDNPVVLRELWDEIESLQYKVYSGLDEEYLDALDKVEVARINESGLRFEELRILFLPAEIERIEEVLKRIGTATRRRLATRYEDFDRFLDCLLEYKEASGIVSSGTAIMGMIEIVEAWIEENTAEEQEQEGLTSHINK